MNADDYRELAAYRDERAREVRPIRIETDRGDERLRTIVVVSGNTSIASVQLNLRELGVIRRLIEQELLGGSEPDILVDAIRDRIIDGFPLDPHHTRSAVRDVLEGLDAVLSDATERGAES